MIYGAAVNRLTSPQATKKIPSPSRGGQGKRGEIGSCICRPGQKNITTYISYVNILITWSHRGQYCINTCILLADTKLILPAAGKLPEDSRFERCTAQRSPPSRKLGQSRWFNYRFVCSTKSRRVNPEDPTALTQIHQTYFGQHLPHLSEWHDNKYNYASQILTYLNYLDTFSPQKTQRQHIDIIRDTPKPANTTTGIPR